MYAISHRQHHAGAGIARAYAGFPCVMASASWLRVKNTTTDQKPEPRWPTSISP
jgi:hypothetical protein